MEPVTSKLKRARLFAHLPEAAPDFIGSLLYLLDHNVRAATLVGIVGARALSPKSSHLSTASPLAGLVPAIHVFDSPS